MWRFRSIYKFLKYFDIIRCIIDTVSDFKNTLWKLPLVVVSLHLNTMDTVSEEEAAVFYLKLFMSLYTWNILVVERYQQRISLSLFVFFFKLFHFGNRLFARTQANVTNCISHNFGKIHIAFFKATSIRFQYSQKLL